MVRTDPGTPCVNTDETLETPKGRLYENTILLIGFAQFAAGMGDSWRGPGRSSCSFSFYFLSYRLIRGWRQSWKLFYLYKHRQLEITRVCAWNPWAEIPRRHCSRRNGGIPLV